MNIRKAEHKDLPFIVALLADDDLGKSRESLQTVALEPYEIAFDKINIDDNQELMVLEDEHREIIGTFQLSFIQYLTYTGGLRAQIEAVRIRKDKRGLGLGKIMFLWAIERGQERKAHLLQLTTDKKRPEALEFYKSLGFKASHEGMKLHFE
ncbi:MAG: GNAT superfamily N-acetyltransferase [Crocinitomix sp.]|jgi:GNAT superfamily N-acetyltransferase